MPGRAEEGRAMIEALIIAGITEQTIEEVRRRIEKQFPESGIGGLYVEKRGHHGKLSLLLIRCPITRRDSSVAVFLNDYDLVAMLKHASIFMQQTRESRNQRVAA
jgi:hypothetical protein